MLRNDKMASTIYKFFTDIFHGKDASDDEEDPITERSTLRKSSMNGKNDVQSIFNAIKNDLAEYFHNPDYIFHEKAFEEGSPGTS